MGRGILVALTLATLSALPLGRAAAVATRPQTAHGPAKALAASTTPEAALAQLVAGTGASYAGDCSTTRAPEDIGKVCSRFVAARATLRAYMLGRTFSESSAWAFVQQVGGGWEPAGTVPLDPYAANGEVPWPPA